MAYRLSRKAEDDLIAIYLDGVQAFGVSQAERYHLELEGVLQYLAAFPRAARERREIDPPVRVHPYKAHLIVYLPQEDDVLILRIRHGHEDWIAGS
jgi:toxin ParE1/3/4